MIPNPKPKQRCSQAKQVPGTELTVSASSTPIYAPRMHALLNTCRFERMGCFTFSEEDGTPAASLPEQVPPKLRQRRRDELTSIQQRLGEEWAAARVGQHVDVLVDGYNDDGFMIGRTQWDAPDVDPLVFLSEPEDPSESDNILGIINGLHVALCVVNAVCGIGLCVSRGAFNGVCARRRGSGTALPVQQSCQWCVQSIRRCAAIL